MTFRPNWTLRRSLPIASSYSWSVCVAGGVLWTAIDASGWSFLLNVPCGYAFVGKSLPQTPLAAPYPTAASQTDHGVAVP